MARRSFDVFDLIELFTHWHAGRSQRQLAESLGIDRKTVAKYLAPAIEESMLPGGDPVPEQGWSVHIARWFPEVADPGLRAGTWPEIEAHRDRIVGWLAADVTVATIAQRLRDDHGMGASESSVRRWIGANLAEESAREKVTVARGSVEAGSEAQIDYGRLGMWLDPATGRRVAVWAFCDGAVVLAAPVRAAGDPDGPILVVRLACGGVRVLRRGSRPAGARQFEDRDRQAGPV